MFKLRTTARAKAETRRGIAEWAVTITLLLFGTTTLAQAFVIPTGSMESTLLVGDHLLVDKFAYAPSDTFSKSILPYQEPKHGDIIVFRYPPDLQQTLVKRLIGAPGDRIRTSDGVLYRNGVRLQEPYVIHQRGAAAQDDFPNPCCRPVKEESAVLAQQQMLSRNVVDHELVVPPGMYFAMGDNRDNSSDSRYWGFVPRENIIGKPLIIFWSYAASTEDMLAATPAAIVKHLADVSEHFFTATRWNRTFMLVRGVPDSELPASR